jgi:hypothetical protein
MKKITFILAEVVGNRLKVNLAGKEFYRDYDSHEHAKAALEGVLTFGKQLGFRDILKDNG